MSLTNSVSKCGTGFKNQGFLPRSITAIVVPSAPGPAPDTSTTGDPIFNSIWTMSKLPVVTLPVDLSPEGLPLAIQVIGIASPYSTVLRLARWCESVLREAFLKNGKVCGPHDRPRRHARPRADRHARRPRSARPTLTGRTRCLPVLTRKSSVPTPSSQARESLEETSAGSSSRPRRSGRWPTSCGQLRELTEKLDENTVEIAAFGMVSRGKSSVLNALLRPGGLQGRRRPTARPSSRRPQRWEHATIDRAPGLDGAQARPGRHAGDRRGRRRGPRGPGPRRRPARRPDPVRRLQRHAARRVRGPVASSARPRSRSSWSSTRSTATPTPTATRSTPRSRTSGSAT